MAAAELKRAAERADLCSASNATGSGLRGEYFAKEPVAAAPLLVRVDPTIDFDPTLDWPANLAGRRPSAVRWTGWVKPPYAGSYRFHVEQRAARVVVARQVLVDNGVATGATIHLDAGRFYPIDVDVGRLDALVGRLMLEWTAPARGALRRAARAAVPADRRHAVLKERPSGRRPNQAPAPSIIWPLPRRCAKQSRDAWSQLRMNDPMISGFQPLNQSACKEYPAGMLAVVVVRREPPVREGGGIGHGVREVERHFRETAPDGSWGMRRRPGRPYGSCGPANPDGRRPSIAETSRWPRSCCRQGRWLGVPPSWGPGR